MSSDEAGPFGSRANGRNSAGITAVAMTPGEFRPLGIEMQSAATITELAESSGEGASHWSRAGGTTNTAAVAVENADEARPPGFAKHSASGRIGTRIAVSPGDAGSSRSRVGGTTLGVEVPKISCQSSKKKILRSETLSGRRNRTESRGAAQDLTLGLR